MHLLIKITTDIHKQLIANYKYYFRINARTVTSYLQSPEKNSLLGMGQCATSEISFVKRNKLNVPTLILSPVKQFPPQMKAQLPNVLEVGVVDDLQCVVGVLLLHCLSETIEPGCQKYPSLKHT